GGPEKSLLGDALRLAGSVIKGPSETSAVSKLFGIDDAILIPAVVQVVMALAKNQAGGPEKSLLGDALRLAGSVIKGPSETSAASKLFGIDDAILIPAVVQVVMALAKNQAGGPEKSLLGDALRLAGAVIKGRPESNGASKLFGIDDAILIPIVAQVVTALAKQHRFNDRPAMSTDDAWGVPAWMHPDRAMTP
ncbi:MAG: hypothetical protein JNK85_30165, partial [Verrucomicrobiales bacterium]|nr:hypothetical protein [Verrucomicrobiales bacterium]